ncbi:Uncharacterised protein [Mycobacterium tuberculosis]|nr:Uncharacterised protein [Mycobacterium tuberculosis]
MGLTESSAAASALAAAPFAKHTVGLASLSLMSTVFDVDLLIVPERIRQRRAIRSIRSRRVAPAERCQTPQVTVQSRNRLIPPVHRAPTNTNHGKPVAARPNRVTADQWPDLKSAERAHG